MKKPNEIQQYADIYLLLNYSTCFGRPSRPSSGVHTTVVAASGTDHSIWGASPTPLIWSRLRKLAPQILRSVPVAATTVLCTPDDGRDGRPKHVEEFSSKQLSAYCCISLDFFNQHVILYCVMRQSQSMNQVRTRSLGERCHKTPTKPFTVTS